MRGVLTITIVYDGETPYPKRSGARMVLKAATDTLKILGEIEKGLNKTKRTKIKWDVHIFSLSDRAVIEFFPIDLRVAESAKLDEISELIGTALAKARRRD